MNIIIRDVEMPTNCDMCWALDDYGDYPRCLITKEQRGYNFPIRQKCMDNCPLGLGRPHGRLIDAEVLCERLMTAWHTADSEGRRIIGEVIADVVTPIVVSMPTIIEAEGGK